MKEYGGYLGLELNSMRKAYYYDYHPKMFQCARNAILYVIKQGNFSKVYIPVYLCSSVRDTLLNNDINIVEYHLEDNFVPLLDFVEEDAAVVITNYFGVRHNDTNVVSRYGNVIFDNTQAFYEEPVKGAYNVYSCRKFFGVTDGAYLITDITMKCQNVEFERFVPPSSKYLVESLVFGTNHSYMDSLRNEEALSKGGIKNISELSDKLLGCIDYEYVQEKRKENYLILKDMLSLYNEINDSIADNAVPMVYPLLISDKSLRRKIVNNNIFVPQWWKVVFEENRGNEFENRLSQYLLPLPVDQRYSKQDMKAMVEIIYGLFDR